MSANGTVHLDARSVEDLFAEARSRVARACPELGAGSGPDPATTLLHLFAWMTGLAVERADRLPEKLHVELLGMLGIELQGPAAARAGVRLRLSSPAADRMRIAAGTEIGTLRTATQPSIVFQVLEDFDLLPVRPVAYVVERAGAAKEIGVADGVAHPHGPDQMPFARPPQVGDALYIGFAESIGRLLLQISIEASMARGAGVNPEDPPLRWEVSQGEREWAEVDVLEDLTGGFNYGSGTVEVQCPARSGVEPIVGQRLHWLRCRIAETMRISGQPAIYQHAPEIYRLTAHPLGALVEAEHSVTEIAEPLGVSEGTPGQAFATRFRPVLALGEGEAVEVEDEHGDWEPWERRDTFADSRADERHFGLDAVGGEIRFGPELRRRDGTPDQRGAIPAKGAHVRFSRYRHGGGSAGNVPAGELNVLRSAIPGMASVTNPQPALGGVDPQRIESARDRAALEIRTRHRAVTSEDFEYLATEASARIARAVRVQDGEPGVTLRVLPQVDPPDRRLTLAELVPDDALLETVGRHLDARKPVGCPVRLLPMRFRAVSVVVNAQAAPRADVQRLEGEIRDALYRYLNPLVGGDATGPSDGWPFGRPLNQGELYAIVHAFEGIDFVRILRLYEFDLTTGEQSPKAAGRQILIEPDEVIASGEHIVRLARRAS